LIIRDPNCNGRVKFPARYPETIAVAAADCDAHIAYYSIPGEEVDLVAPGGTRGCPVISLLSSGISTSSPANTCVTSSNPAAAGAVADPLAAAGEGGEGEGGECLAATGDGGEALNVAAGEGGEGEGGEGEGGEGEGGEAYGRGSGTSQAAAHVTGVVALMLDVNPWLTPDEVRMILLETAVFDPSISMLQQGAGRINADAAVRRAGMLRYNSHDYRYNSHD
jgi:subtilisin family serine protease